MNVETIKMDPQVARDRLLAYRRALRKGADAEYQAALAGYEALARGTPLVQYGTAILRAPRDDKGRPMLAIARADRKQVAVSAPHQRITFDTSPAWSQYDTLRIDIADPDNRQLAYGFALVPMVPPDGIAAIGGRSSLREHLILWEVEKWADRRIGAAPDRDPLLLRPIHGDLCAVVHAWELTDLERAVMAGRAFA